MHKQKIIKLVPIVNSVRVTGWTTGPVSSRWLPLATDKTPQQPTRVYGRCTSKPFPIRPTSLDQKSHLHSASSFLNSTCRNTIRTVTGNDGVPATRNRSPSQAEDVAEQATATADDAATARQTAPENCSQKMETEHLRNLITVILRVRERAGEASRQVRRAENRCGLVA